MRQREKEVAVREMFANVAALSREGHEEFIKYLNSFDRKKTWSQIQKGMSEQMLRFLGKAPNGEDK